MYCISAEAHERALCPNYDLTVDDVFVQTTSFLLDRDVKSMSLLYAAGVGRSRPLC